MKTSLYYREGSSDKVYQVEMAPTGGLFLVNFAFGQRGSTLNTGSKTPAPVDEARAREIFTKLVREKKAKGYTEGEDGTPYQSSEAEGRVSGHLPQLLNPIGEDELEFYLTKPNWCMQQKFDGKRLLLRKDGSTVRGINRRGLYVGIPQSFVQSALLIEEEFVIDGEAVGETYYAFDLLEHGGESVRHWPYRNRLQKLWELLASANPPAFPPVPSFTVPDEKRELLTRLRNDDREGVVFKDLDAPFSAGRPASGGSQVKFKFRADGAFVVKAVNRNRRSVGLCLYDGEEPVEVGNVTVPLNHAIRNPGRSCRCATSTHFRKAARCSSLFINGNATIWNRWIAF